MNTIVIRVLFERSLRGAGCYFCSSVFNHCVFGFDSKLQEVCHFLAVLCIKTVFTLPYLTKTTNWTKFQLWSNPIHEVSMRLSINGIKYIPFSRILKFSLLSRKRFQTTIFNVHCNSEISLDSAAWLVYLAEGLRCQRTALGLLMVMSISSCLSPSIELNVIHTFRIFDAEFFFST